MIGHLHDYYIARAARIRDRESTPETMPDAERWRTMRPQVHRQFMVSLGLAELPPKCDLRATVTGTFEGEGYTAEKIAYQLLPDVWGSAHLYRPAGVALDTPAPAVLYTCGHHLAGVVGYQHHPAAWAQRGYVCLIFDTIEQHGNGGDHHGLYCARRPDWIEMGYAGAGGEVLNGIRALDLLLSQRGVDPRRVGVTGLSGGGSQSFRLAAADDRLRAVATVAGVSDPAYAIPNRMVEQHCDCMYEHNRFARDAAVWGALIAPRPLLYCFARHDNLYIPDEFRDLHRRTRERYAKLGVGELCELVEYDGQHGYNHKSTTDAIHDWFDRHVAGEPHPDADPLGIAAAGKIQAEPTLSVFHGVMPEPQRLDLLPELLSRRGQVRLPDSPAHWQEIRAQAVERLRGEVFHLIDDVAEPQTLTQLGDWTHQGTDRLQWNGTLDGVRQTIVQTDTASGERPAVLVGVGNREDTAFVLARTTREVVGGAVSTLAIEPRLTGRAAPHPAGMPLLTREGCLVGMTPTMLMVQDLHHLWPHLLALPRVHGRAIYLYGRGEGAVATLFHALLHPDPAVKGVILEDLPRPQAGVYPILGLRTVMDLAQAVGLLAPLPVALVRPAGMGFDWYWADRAHARLSRPSTLIPAVSLAAAITRLGVPLDH